MRALIGSIVAMATIAALTSVVTVSQEARTGSNRTVTSEDVERWKKELSNWGRWGQDDQLGTINLITPAKRKQAVALAKEGFVVSLARDLITEKAADNNWPFEHTYVGIGNDRFGIQYHGFAHTHLDSLAHVADNGVFYNGYKPDALLGGDSWQEVMPAKNAGSIHSMMTYLGLHLFDNCDLEALSAATGARMRWEFMLMATPLAVRGGTGSPINPIAMF